MANCKMLLSYSEEENDNIVDKLTVEFIPTEYLLVNKIISRLALGEPLELSDNEDKRDLTRLSEDFKNPEHIVLENNNQMNQESSKSPWISVNEKLPETIEPVNITFVNHNPPFYYSDFKNKPLTATAHYCNGEWFWYSSTCEDYLEEYGKCDADKMDSAIEVIAWSPIPNPYDIKQRHEVEQCQDGIK